MDAKDVRQNLLPYLLAILLVGLSVLLDGMLDRGRRAAAENFDLWGQIVRLIGARLIFALLSALLIWSLARLGLSFGGAFLFCVSGLVVSAGPAAYFGGWLRNTLISGFLPGSYFLLSGAVLLAGGIVGFFVRYQQTKEPTAPPTYRQELP